MANQLFVNPFPYGEDNTQRDEIIDGSLVLCGSAVSTTVGESINWQNLLSGLGYNESNFRGSGGTQFGLNNGSALVTAERLQQPLRITSTSARRSLSWAIPPFSAFCSMV
jgi:hypothetical protein